MARTKKAPEAQATQVSPNQLISKFLKDNEKDHYNFEK